MQVRKIPYRNPIMGADSYKLGHFAFMDPEVSFMSAYAEARKDTLGWGDHVLFGLQAFLYDKMLERITKEHVEHAAAKAKAHGEPFNYAGWMRIVEVHGGYMPVEIQAIPEGLPVPFRTPVYQVVNTDPKLPWVSSYIETRLLRAVWYPSTVASLSRHVKKRLARALDETEGNRDFLPFMLHDFGGRGVSSEASAEIGGGAHLINFMGTDTLEALGWLETYYDDPMAGFSVAAAEHSTIQSFGPPDREICALEWALDNLLLAKPGTIGSFVSDTYDLYNMVGNIMGDKLNSKIRKLEALGSKLVARPDSGNATQVPVDVVEIFLARFPFTHSRLGYKKLAPYLGCLQGDGMEDPTIDELHNNVKRAGHSSANYVVGMGGGLLQKVNRDTMGWAQKASARITNVALEGNNWQDLAKKPKTDPSKNSKPGRQAVVMINGVATAKRESEVLPGDNILRPVYRNGEVYSNLTLAQVRANAELK